MRKIHSIRKKVQFVTIGTALIALLLTSAVGLFGMLNIQGETSQGGYEIAKETTQKSEEALLEQMQQNMQDIVVQQAQIAQSELQKYADFAQSFASYTEKLYAAPDDYLPKEVAPPLLENGGILSMQRYLADESVSLSAVWEELCLLGNLENVFSPFMESYGETVATVYVGTESGFLLSYDTASSGAFNGVQDTEEFYFSYQQSDWYTLAKTEGKTIFTDTYADSYGRGMTITCAAPIYNSQGDFMGAVGIDILVDDLNQSIISIDVSPNSHAFIVRQNGDIIVSHDLDSNADSFENILKDQELPAYEVSGAILSGEHGVALTSDDIYFAYCPIPASSWTFVIYIPSSDIISPVESIREEIQTSVQNVSLAVADWIWFVIWIFLVSFAVILLAVILLSNRLSRKITQPLVTLSNDVSIVSEGNLEHRTEVSSQDEIGKLACAFNNMTQSLRNHISQLTAMTAEKERIAAELNVAQNIQASMLPCIFPPFPQYREFDIYAKMSPAKEVGGDFYDLFLVDRDHLALVIADVSGKGVPAALFMVIAKTLLKNATQSGLSPKAILETVNNQLCESNDAGMFVTTWIGILEISTGKMVCANAGHEYPALKRKNGTFALYKDRHGFVLAGMENVKYTEYELTLSSGDTLFVYTDGVTEATDTQNQLFGTERMLQSLNAREFTHCEELLDCLQADIDQFSGEAPQFDDITMLALQINNLHTIHLDITLESIEKATAFVEEELSQAHIQHNIINRMSMVTDEIYTNIVSYSGASWGEICCEIREDTLILTFTDNGKAYNPLSAPEPDITLDAEKRGIGGLGIHIVKNMVNDMSYQRSGEINSLTLTKTIAP